VWALAIREPYFLCIWMIKQNMGSKFIFKPLLFSKKLIKFDIYFATRENKNKKKEEFSNLF